MVDQLSYRVHVMPGALDALGGVARVVARTHRYALITDSNVGPLYAERACSALGAERTQLFTDGRRRREHKTHT